MLNREIGIGLCHKQVLNVHKTMQDVYSLSYLTYMYEQHQIRVEPNKKTGGNHYYRRELSKMSSGFYIQRKSIFG